MIEKIEITQRFNFRTDRVVPNYYTDGDGAIIMYLPLRKCHVSGD